MNTERDVTRIVRSWLRTEEYESADRVLANVLAQLDTTPRRRSWWPARRFADMNTYAKLAIAAAAVVVVAVVGLNLLPARGGVGGPAPTATPTPTPTPSPSPSSSPSLAVFPPPGTLAAGTHSMTRGGVRLSVTVPAGWHSGAPAFINKDTGVGPDGASFLFWDPDPAGVYANPCAHRISPVPGTSAADLATAVATMPDIKLVSPPSDVTVGGRAAKHLVLTVPKDAKCPAGDGGFYLWYAEGAGSPCGDAGPCPRYPTALGVTIRVWIIDVNGKRLFIEAESYEGAGPDVGQEIQRIVDSIRFD